MKMKRRITNLQALLYTTNFKKMCHYDGKIKK